MQAIFDDLLRGLDDEDSGFHIYNTTLAVVDAGFTVLANRDLNGVEAEIITFSAPVLLSVLEKIGSVGLRIRQHPFDIWHHIPHAGATYL